jgi:hypothetical protein
MSLVIYGRLKNYNFSSQWRSLVMSKSGVAPRLPSDLESEVVSLMPFNRLNGRSGFLGSNLKTIGGL